MGQQGSNPLDPTENSALDQQLNSYRTPLPGVFHAYMQNLQKGGLLNFPSFDEMFNSYKKIANTEADRQAASINESFGSQGGRYSSDLLGAQGRMRENTANDLAVKAGEYQRGLRQDQFHEVSGLANMQYGRDEAAQNRYWQDFLRRTSPPPGAGGPADLSAGYGLPASRIK